MIPEITSGIISHAHVALSSSGSASGIAPWIALMISFGIAGASIIYVRSRT